MSIRHASIVLAGLTAVSGVVLAQDGKGPRDPSKAHHEVPQDPPAPAHLIPTLLSTPFVPGGPAGGPVPGNQVNVSPNGLNIVGDAANEPSIAVDPLAPNRIVIGWRQFDTIVSNFRQAGNAYSHDGGRTWHNDGPIDPGIFRSDPVLDSDANGTFFYYSLTTENGDFVCDLYRSEDGGVTWDDGVDAGGGDKQWMSVDKNSVGQGQGNVYALWSPFFSCCFGNFTRSVDNGQTFMNPMTLPENIFWGATAVGPGGRLYMAGIDLTYEPLVMRSVSAQNPLQLPNIDLVSHIDLGGEVDNGAGPNPGGLLGQVWVGVDHSNPANVYVVASVNPPGPDPLDVNFAASNDFGATWSAPITLNDDPGNAWQWFGTMSVAPNGRIDVVWNDTRNDPSGDFSELMYTSSSDGGANWTPNEVISPAFNHFLGYPQQNKLGDYYHMVSDNTGAHLAWAATFNGEQDVYYKRIGEYDCNGNGIGDPTDIGDGTSGDCNANDIPDECEIAAGTLADVNDNGIPDDCESDGDVDGDGMVGITDLLALLAAWGDCPDPPALCPADFDGDGEVSITDLLTLLANWT